MISAPFQLNERETCGVKQPASASVGFLPAKAWAPWVSQPRARFSRELYLIIRTWRLHGWRDIGLWVLGFFFSLDGITVVIAEGLGMPDQADHSGKILSTTELKLPWTSLPGSRLPQTCRRNCLHSACQSPLVVLLHSSPTYLLGKYQSMPCGPVLVFQCPFSTYSTVSILSCPVLPCPLLSRANCGTFDTMN